MTTAEEIERVQAELPLGSRVRLRLTDGSEVVAVRTCSELTLEDGGPLPAAVQIERVLVDAATDGAE